MDPEAWISEESGRRRTLSVPRVAVALLAGVVFAAAFVLAAVLPAVAAAYLVVGFAVREVVVVLVLWAASATLSIVGFIVISRTYVGSVLRRVR